MKKTCWIPIYGLLSVLLLGGCSSRQVEKRLEANEKATTAAQTDVQALEQRVLSMEGRLSALSSDVENLEVKTRKGGKSPYVVAPAFKAIPVTPVAAASASATPVVTPVAATSPSGQTPYVPLSAGTVPAPASSTPTAAGTQSPTPSGTYTPMAAGTPARSVPTGTALSLPPTSAPSPVQNVPASAPRPTQTAPQSTPRPASNITPAPTAAATPIPAQSAVSLALPPEAPTAVFGQPSGAVASATSGSGAPAAPAAQAMVPSASPASAPVSLAPLAPKVKGEESAYNAALALVRGGQTAEAIKRFTAFLQDYPTGRYAPNAYYWIGECLYAQRKYPEALLQFKDVATRYPRHHKTADALLKAGMTYDRLGDKENAALQYAALKTDFPNSEAARRVKGRGAAR